MSSHRIPTYRSNQGYSMNYHGSSHGLPYFEPSSYRRTLPRPTSSGTLENDVKRQKVERPYQPDPYYVQPYAQPAPYYPKAPSYGPYWNHGRCADSTPYMPVQAPAAAPAVAAPAVAAPAVAAPAAAAPATIHAPASEHIQRRAEQADNEESDGEENEQDLNQADPSKATISGTSITLQTEEDIVKWREERRKMWLLKISNKRQEHMQRMGVKEDELKGRSVLQESRKQKQFIQSIQNQVSRANPKANLNVKIVQREMAQENCQLLEFITELGDAHLLEYELTAEEKSKLFGPLLDKPGFHPHTAKKPYTRRRLNV